MDVVVMSRNLPQRVPDAKIAALSKYVPVYGISECSVATHHYVECVAARMVRQSVGSHPADRQNAGIGVSDVAGKVGCIGYEAPSSDEGDSVGGGRERSRGHSRSCHETQT